MAEVEEVVLPPPQDGQSDQEEEAEKEDQIKSEVTEKGVGKEDRGEKEVRTNKKIKVSSLIIIYCRILMDDFRPSYMYHSHLTRFKWRAARLLKAKQAR